MDTDRDMDIALLEVQQENAELVEAFYREKMGKRAQRMTDGSGQGGIEAQSVEGGYAGGQAPELGGLPPV